MSVSPLFTPLRIGSLELRNRIVMAPMTREASAGGIPTEQMANYYRRRAAGGTALIITEGTPPNAAGTFGANVPRMYGDDVREGWSRIVAAVHDEGALIFAQLWHVGAFSPSLIGMTDSLPIGHPRLSPSGLAGPGRPFGSTMTVEDIERTVSDFGRAAALARDVGFDGVEIHGAHGYLPDQFLWSETNQRSDAYGGTIDARTRFACDVVRACKNDAGVDFPLSFRLSQWKQFDYQARLANSPQELAAVTAPLVAAGVDLFHCSTRRFWEPEFANDERNLAAWVRTLTDRPTITVGSVSLDTEFKAPAGKLHAATAPGHLEQLERAILVGQYDLVAIGRALLANPDWVHKVAAGGFASLRAFDRRMLEDLI